MNGIDLKRLEKDIDKQSKARPKGVAPSGRLLTGSMQIIRDNLLALEKLHADGATWVDIAAGLGEQGVTQGDGQPITGRRLTSLINAIRRQDERRAAKAASRLTNRDIVPAEPKPTIRSKRLSLAAELHAQSQASSAAIGDAEEAIRRSAYEINEVVFQKTGLVHDAGHSGRTR